MLTHERHPGALVAWNSPVGRLHTQTLGLGRLATEEDMGPATPYSLLLLPLDVCMALQVPPRYSQVDNVASLALISVSFFKMCLALHELT